MSYIGRGTLADHRGVFSGVLPNVDGAGSPAAQQGGAVGVNPSDFAAALAAASSVTGTGTGAGSSIDVAGVSGGEVVSAGISLILVYSGAGAGTHTFTATAPAGAAAFQQTVQLHDQATTAASIVGTVDIDAAGEVVVSATAGGNNTYVGDLSMSRLA